MNKNKIILIIIFSIFFILSISTFYSTVKQKEYIELKHKQSFEILQQMIDGKIIFFRKQYAARIRNIIYNSPDFKDVILSNNKLEIKKMMNRFFLLLKKENKYTKTLHLVSKDNISIYRAHKPEKHGDDLSQFRSVIKYVNANKRAKYGFESGLHTMAYRVDIPIVYGNEHYGVLEYGIDANLFVDDLTSVSDYIESAILINKEDIEKIKSVGKLDLKDTIVAVSQKYLLFDNDIFFNNLNIDNIQNDHHFEYLDEHYTPFFYNLLSYKGDIAGKILIAMNMTADKKMYDNIIKLSVVKQMILILIIFIIVYYAFRYYENRIKNLIYQEKQNERILHQQSKMASMGEMIGNIAHQWRQPLSVISTVASGIVVQKEFNIFNENVIEDSMGKIINQTEYMSKTINDFRDFFKSDKEKIEFNLNNVIKQNIALIESSYYNYEIELIKELNDSIVLEGFPNELTQAILNILNNAKDQLLKLDESIPRFVKLETIKDKNDICIIISDNGGGISNDIIHKIFEPYFTTKHKSQGTGIGLYMTHEIIVKHFHGEMLVSNEEIEYKDKTYKCAQFKIVLHIDPLL